MHLLQSAFAMRKRPDIRDEHSPIYIRRPADRHISLGALYALRATCLLKLNMEEIKLGPIRAPFRHARPVQRVEPFTFLDDRSEVS